MSAPKTPLELMMQQAQEMAKAFNPALESFSPQIRAGADDDWGTKF